MTKKGPPPDFRYSLLRADGDAVYRTSHEANTDRFNMHGGALFGIAIEATGMRFEDDPKAVLAGRTGRAPRGGGIPATNASSLYSSTNYSGRRR